MSRKPCTPGRSNCQAYWPGHQLHWIPAKFVGQAPWGWRDGVVTAIHGSDVTVQYVETDHVLRLWHHRQLRLAVGQPVRVHERFHVAAGPFGWANVAVTNGLGPVPEPASPELWRPEQSIPVVDLGSGYALPENPS